MQHAPLLLSVTLLMLARRTSTTLAFRCSHCTARRRSAQRGVAPRRQRNLLHSNHKPLDRRYLVASANNFALPTTIHRQGSVQAVQTFRTTALQARKKQQQKFSVLPQHPIEKPYHLVIVESPSKCKTIEKILQEYAQNQGLSYSFIVTSCLGHIRNLPTGKEAQQSTAATSSRTSRFPYDIAGVDLDNHYQATYVVIPGKERVVRDLTTLAQDADKVLLATDPDREGEAMAWHLQQVLGESVPYERISFTEITPSAVQRAVQYPVSINPGLVQAQETRRILDRLAGFTVSPLLWKKIAPGLSAGRVQSVGMALVVQRERQRLMFESTQYSSIHASFSLGNLTAQLRAINDTPVALSGKDFSSQGQTLTVASSHKIHLQQDNAADFVDVFADNTTEWKVTEVKATKRQQQPPQPYRTSTLQQDANRRLGLGVEQCMRTAQQLYENGLISYMRTDATFLSEDAEASVEQAVVGAYGRDMYEKRQGSSSKHKKDSKFAQEAHEAIRPAIQLDGTFQNPDSLDLPQVAKDLYRMIHQRTLACRMPNLITNLTQVTIEATIDDTVGTFRVSGSVVVSPGYTAAYGALEEDSEEPEKKELPPLHEGQILDNTGVDAVAHETQPPPRYTEASFVKELEALGVGRPSTYANIVRILRERAYVGSPTANRIVGQKPDISGSAISAHRAAGGEEFTGSSKGSLVPSLPAFAVCSLLENHCSTYVDSEFTSKMEERLDHIANSESSSEQERLSYLEEFYEGENGLAMTVKRLEETIGGEELRRVELPSLGPEEAQADNAYSDIRLLVGPWGPYVQGTTKDGETITGPLPASMTVDLSTITRRNIESILSTKNAGGYLLGVHPEHGRNLRLKTGRFGPYIQCGEDGESNSTTHSLPRGLPLADSYDCNSEDGALPDDYPPNLPFLSFEEVLGYASLPKKVASVDGTQVTAAIGPYGPYLKCNSTYVSLDSENDILTIDAETAETMMREALASGGKRKPQGTIADLGEMNGSMVRVKSGRFGKYINWKRTNVKLPEMYSEDSNLPSLEEAWELICEKNEGTLKSPKLGRNMAKSSDLPPPPKRPLSAYLLFCSENREKNAEKKLSLGESSKILSQMWAEISAEDKARFDAEAAVKKEEYERERAKWKEECNILSKSDSLLGRNGKTAKSAFQSSSSSSLPKRPKSAYLFFCAEKRPEVSSKVKSLGEISKELARLWRDTTDRAKYEKLAASDKERYEREKDEANKIPSEVNGASKATTSATRTSSSQNSPSKRSPSAYMLFCKEFRASIVGDDGNKLPMVETTKRLASMWKSCDSDTRKKFEQMALDEKVDQSQGEYLDPIC